MGCKDCIGRVPYVSLVASTIMMLGVVLFCYTLYEAISITVGGIFKDLFQFDVPWLQTIRILFTVIGVGMGVMALVLLLFAFLATGATRKNIYSGAKCMMGGRVSAAFVSEEGNTIYCPADTIYCLLFPFLVITFIMNLAWIGVTSSLAMPVIIYAMLLSVCVWEIEDKPAYMTDDYCLNLSRFGVYRNFTIEVDKNALCDTAELSTFCKHVCLPLVVVHDAGPMYVMALAGSSLIVVGLILFLMTLVSNYQRITIGKELTEYREAVNIELQNSDQTFVLQNSAFERSYNC